LNGAKRLAGFAAMTLRSRGISRPSCPLFSLLPRKFREFPIGSGLVLKEEPLSLAIDFVAIQIVLVRPVSVVRDYTQLSPDIRPGLGKLATIGNEKQNGNGRKPANQVWKPDSAG
jgi:hypothetical protein